MSRWWRGEAVASQAQAYQRSPLEPLPCGADLPAPLLLQQRRDRLRAGQLRARGQGEGEDSTAPAARRPVRWPRSARAAACRCRTPRRRSRNRAGSRRRRRHADVDGQLSLGAELQVRRQPHDQRLDRVLDVLAGNPLPGADQRVPGLLPHVGQVHRVDPVGHLPRAPQVLALDSRGGLAGLFLPGLVDRPDHQAAPPPPAPRRVLQPGRREPAHHAHRGEGVPARVIEQPLGPVRRLVPGVPGDAPPVSLRQLAHHRGGVLARLQPRLRPGETRPQQRQQLTAVSAAPARHLS